ncbi:unnamed protein product [Diabrotica balteata]|uniref:C-type lectin domain-containing protein n=1 Tax=Diabrotica balteata TaxID=107213 RepID=A0A9N9TC41_DIABA|nr:unnamed protein product [Diabrotica balteata]
MLSRGVLLLFAIAAYVQGTPVQKGWLKGGADVPNVPLVKHGNKAYFLGVNYKANFQEALQFCDVLYMKLLTIDSEEENDAIKKIILDNRSTGTEYWTSAANFLDNRNFVWMSTGKTVEHTKWENGEPSYNGEKCVQLWEKNNDILWNDRDCNTKLNFICQRENHEAVPAVASAVVPPAAVGKPSYSPNINMLSFNGKNYYFSRDYKGRFTEAAFYCRMLHMSLVTINSAEENQAIEKYIRDNNLGSRWWIAGTRLLDDTWTWFTNGQPIEYTKWDKNQPDNINEKCINLQHTNENGLFWNDINCNEQFPFICEKVTGENVQRVKRDAFNEEEDPDADEFVNAVYAAIVEDDGGEQTQVATVATTEEDDDELEPVTDEEWQAAMEDTPPGFLTYTYNAGKKYHIELEMLGTQKQAQVFCEYHGLQLLAIENDQETESTKKVLEDVGEDGPFWISGRRPLSDWRWLRINRPIIYQKLEPNETLFVDDRTCLTILLNGIWRLEKCEKVRPFICENQEKAVPGGHVPKDDVVGNVGKDNDKKEVAPSAAPVYKKNCLVKPIVNVYINNNLVSSGVSLARGADEGHKNQGTYSVNVNNSLRPCGNK